MPNSLKVFLNTSPAEALKLAPATIINGFDDDCPTERVRRYLAAAVRLSMMVNQRLTRLHVSPRKAAMWNDPDGPEHYWFGEYTDRKVEKACRTFEGITRHLSSRRLDITCSYRKELFGMAFPGLEKIWLYRYWRLPRRGSEIDDDAERVQTFVHEASHICGRTSFAELNARNYGRDAAHRLTKWRMRATRNADNYGYYALDVLERACAY